MGKPKLWCLQNGHCEKYKLATNVDEAGMEAKDSIEGGMGGDRQEGESWKILN